MPVDDPTTPRPGLDSESRAWLRRLAPDSPQRDAAVAELHALLLKAARFEVARRRAGLAHLRGTEADDLARQSANDALLAVLRKLGDFRGDSRFTTWAYKFALLETSVGIRRRAWQGRELPLAEEGWARLPTTAAGPDQQAETSELITALREAITQDLTPHQREVLVAVALNDVPIDVLAERLGTTRGALYKTIHDARRRLRTLMRARGLSVGDQERTVS